MEDYLFEFVDTLHQSLKKLLRQVGSDSGFSTLTISQLHYIEAISRLGEPTITRLSEELNITKPSVTSGINKLIALGFVMKARSSDDHRVFHVHLTQAAQQMVEARFRALHEYGQLVRSALSDDEVRQFEAAIAKITQLFKDKVIQPNHPSDLPGKEITK